MCVCTMGLHSPARQRVEVVGSWTMHCEENLEYGFKSMRLDLVSWKDTKTWEMGITFWFSHLPWIQSKSSRRKEERSWIWEEQRRTICGFRDKETCVLEPIGSKTQVSFSFSFSKSNFRYSNIFAIPFPLFWLMLRWVDFCWSEMLLCTSTIGQSSEQLDGLGTIPRAVVSSVWNSWRGSL